MVALKGLPVGPDAVMQGVVQAPNRKSIKSSLMGTAQNNKYILTEEKLHGNYEKSLLDEIRSRNIALIACCSECDRYHSTSEEVMNTHRLLELAGTRGQQLHARLSLGRTACLRQPEPALQTVTGRCTR